MSGITITDVKLIGTCSKHRKEGDKPSTYIDGTIVPDEDIECLTCILEADEVKKEQKKD